MKTNVLKDWSIVKRYGNYVVIIGKVYNDIKGRFNDGEEIVTSRVLQADFVNGVIETRNSVYHLED
jgi:hypothetical protein